MSYNLLTEGWIPVLYCNGNYKRVGILNALKHAHEIRQIAATNPMDRVAILRFLLAALYWCKGNPPDDSSLIPPDRFPPLWFDKLDKHKEVFNLLGDGKRFFQYGGLEKGKLLSVNSLIHEIPTGTNILHFRHSLDKQDGLCPACCAMGLLRLPVFATQGGAGKAPGINFKPPIYVMPFGASLAETLRLSWRNVQNLGSPIWEQPNAQIPTSGDLSFLTALTALPRRVWLEEPGDVGQCVSCGREEALIRECVFAGVAKRESPIHWQDPQVVYFMDKDERKSIRAEDPVKPGGFRMDKPWQRLVAAFLESNHTGNAHFPQTFLFVGFATDQTKYIDVWERTVTIESEQDFAGIAEKIRLWQDAGRKLPWRIKTPNRDLSESELAAVNSIRPHVEYSVASELDALINGENDGWEDAAEKYRTMMSAVAHSLAPGFTLEKLRRRKAIERTRPAIEEAEIVKKKRGKQ